MPPNIEYFGAYYHLICHQTQDDLGRFQRCKSPETLWFLSMNRSDLMEMDGLSMDCLVDIKHIKYKNTANQQNYNITNKESIILDIELRIAAIFDEDMDEIDRTEWENYGFVLSEK